MIPKAASDFEHDQHGDWEIDAPEHEMLIARRAASVMAFCSAWRVTYLW
jgi:hypothetical protein